MFLANFNFDSSPLQYYKAPNGEPVVTAYSLIKALKGDTMNAARITKNNVRSKWLTEIPNPNGGKAILCLFEPGAYQLAGNPMFQSELAEKLQDFIFEEVLPKLRASGGYIMPSATSDQLQALQSEISELQERNGYLKKVNQDVSLVDAKLVFIIQAVIDEMLMAVHNETFLRSLMKKSYYEKYDDLWKLLYNLKQALKDLLGSHDVITLHSTRSLTPELTEEKIHDFFNYMALKTRDVTWEANYKKLHNTDFSDWSEKV